MPGTGACWEIEWPFFFFLPLCSHWAETYVILFNCFDGFHDTDDIKHCSHIGFTVCGLWKSSYHGNVYVVSLPVSPTRGICVHHMSNVWDFTWVIKCFVFYLGLIFHEEKWNENWKVVIIIVMISRYNSSSSNSSCSSSSIYLLWHHWQALHWRMLGVIFVQKPKLNFFDNTRWHHSPQLDLNYLFTTLPYCLVKMFLPWQHNECPCLYSSVKAVS